MMRIFFITMLVLSPLLAAAETIPALVGRVSDHAAVLKPAEREAIASRLAAIERSSPDKPQVVVLTVMSLPEGGIEQFANDVFRAWKLGQAGKDNGALLVIAPAQKQIRLEVGFGLESVIPDTRARQIIGAMIPHFQKAPPAYYAAIDQAVTSLAGYVAKAEPAAGLDNGQRRASGLFVLLAIVGCVVAVIYFMRRRERRAEDERERRRAALADDARRTAIRNAAASEHALRNLSRLSNEGVATAAAFAASKKRLPTTPPPRRAPPPPPPPRAQAKKSKPQPQPSRSDDDGSSFVGGAILGAAMSSSRDSSSESYSRSDNSFSSGGGDSGGGGASASWSDSSSSSSGGDSGGGGGGD